MKKSKEDRLKEREKELLNTSLPVEIYDEENLCYRTYLKEFEGEQVHISEHENIYEAFSNQIFFGFYYPYNTAQGHDHGHSFLDVIRELYMAPEEFSIDESDYVYYSKQQLVYLKRLKSLLLTIGLKDIKNYTKEYMSRAVNDKADKFLKYKQYNFKLAKELIDGKVKMLTRGALIKGFSNVENIIVLDDDENYLGIVEATTENIKLRDLPKYDIPFKSLGYETIEEYMEHVKEDQELTSDEDMIGISTFKVLERF